MHPIMILKQELYIDNVKVETAKLPTNFTTRRYELFWKYGLPDQKHTRKHQRYLIQLMMQRSIHGSMLFYSDKPYLKN